MKNPEQNTVDIINQLIQLKTLTHNKDLLHPRVIDRLLDGELIFMYVDFYYLTYKGVDLLNQIDRLYK